ncbi:MAG: 3'(2'),5'-bisphosphate nucleotidase CysQ [Gemmatimonadales bacterium]
MPDSAGGSDTPPLDAGRYAGDLALAMALAEQAAAAIRQLFESGPLAVQEKADHSPVTAADLAANEIIVQGLRIARPEDAILTEEAVDDGRRFATDRVWLVDPLDGTRDFVERSPEFAVHIALVERGEPVVGVVALPMLGQVAAAVRGAGAVLMNAHGAHVLRVAPERGIGMLRTGVSRFAMNPPLTRFLQQNGLTQRAVPCGASVKHVRLADGLLDLCLTLHGRECEWDSAAPGLIVTEAGGRVTDVDGAPLVYNQKNVQHRRGLVLSSGPHHAVLARLAAECFPP